MKYLFLLVLLGGCSTETVTLQKYQCDQAMLDRIAKDTGMKLTCSTDGNTVLIGD